MAFLVATLLRDVRPGAGHVEEPEDAPTTVSVDVRVAEPACAEC
jgi:hypothetical protein